MWVLKGGTELTFEDHGVAGLAPSFTRYLYTAKTEGLRQICWECEQLQRLRSRALACLALGDVVGGKHVGTLIHVIEDSHSILHRFLGRLHLRSGLHLADRGHTVCQHR